MNRNRLANLVLILTLLFLIGPFIIIFITSFSSEVSLKFPPQGFTLDWFKKVISMTMFVDSLKLSLKLGLVSSIIALCLGIPVAYITSRYNFRGKRVIEVITTLPIIIPQMVAGLVLLRLFVLMNIFSVEVTLLIGHTAVVLPYVVRNVLSALINFPVSVEEAAISLGASRLRTFFLIVLPNIRTGIISAFILTFIISFNNVPISLFLTGPGLSTLPVVMLTYLEYYYNPSIAALSTLLIFISAFIVFISQKLLGLSKLM